MLLLVIYVKLHKAMNVHAVPATPRRDHVGFMANTIITHLTHTIQIAIHPARVYHCKYHWRHIFAIILFPSENGILRGGDDPHNISLSPQIIIQAHPRIHASESLNRSENSGVIRVLIVKQFHDLQHNA